MAKLVKYFLLGQGTNFEEFSLDYSGATLNGSEVTFKGGTSTTNVDRVFVGSGMTFDFTQAQAGVDEIYLNGAWADYVRSMSGSTLVLTRASDNTIVKVVTGDKLIFTDGSVLTVDAINYTKGTASAPVPNLSETSVQIREDVSAGVALNNVIKAFGVDQAGVTFGQVLPGAQLIVKGTNGVDVVYVKAGTYVDATQLLSGVDDIYLTGSRSDYTKTKTGSTLVLTRMVGSNTETVKVVSGDNIIFADGFVTTAAELAYLGGTGAAPVPDPSRTTPGLSDVQSIAIDTTNSTGGQGGYFNATDAIVFTVTMKSAVDVNTTGGTPRLKVTLDNGATAWATYDSTLTGGNTNKTMLKFKYTVGSMDTDTNGVSIAAGTASTSAIDFNSGHIYKSGTTTDAKITQSPALVDQASYKVDNTAPVVTDATISISGSTGTGGAYKAGDTVTVVYDPAGDTTLATVTANFTAFGGGAAVAATLATTGANAGKWVATYTLVAGTIDSTNLNVSVTATDHGGLTTTASDVTNATVDNQAPVVADANISISGATGTAGAYKVGDTVVAVFTPTGNADLSAVTVDFTAFGGGAAVAATLATTGANAGKYVASYVVAAGTIDAVNANVSVTATDNAGNATTTADSSNATVDNQAPVVADANISISGATGNANTVYKIGDTVTAVYDPAGNTDLASVAMNFSGFGGNAAVAATLATTGVNAGKYVATYQIVSGSISASNVNVSVSAIDNAGNALTTADTSNTTVDSKAPTVVISSNKSTVLSGDTATVTFTFSEVPAGFTWNGTSGSLTVSNGTLSTLSTTADPKVFTATFSPTAGITQVIGSVSVTPGSFTDAAGNPGVVSGAAMNFLIPVAMATTASITGVTDDVDYVGAAATGAPITAGESSNDTSPTLSGTVSTDLTGNQKLYIYDTVNGVAVLQGSITVTGTSWTYTPGALSVGLHSLSARVEDSTTGAVGASSAAFSHRVQTVTIASFQDNVGTVQGNVSVGGVSDDSTPTIKGTLGVALASGEEVAVYDGTTFLGTATVSGTTWALTPATPLGYASHSFQAVVQATGNTTLANAKVASTAASLTLTDPNAPPAAQVSTLLINDDVATNSTMIGTLTPNTSTDDTVLTVSGAFTGTLATGEVIQIFDNGTQLPGSATVTGSTNGTWTFNTPTLGAGSHTLSAKVFNPSTNLASSAIAGVTVVENSIGAINLAGDTGTTTGTNTTDLTPILSGTLGASLGSGDVLKIYGGASGTTLLGGSSGTAASTGTVTVSGSSWSFTPGTNLGLGSNLIKVTIENDAGTQLRVINSQAITVISPSAPTAVVSTLAANDNTATNGSYTGALTTNTSTDATTLALSGAITGTLGTGEVVQVFDGSTLLGTTTATAGTWTFNTATLPVGSHTFSAKVTNTVTGLSSTSTANSLTILENSVSAPSIYVHTGTASPATRYIMVRQNNTASTTMFVGEVQVMSNGVNVALNKPITTKGITTWAGYDSNYANDGVTGVASNGFAANVASVDNWLQIDLGAYYAVDQVKVYTIGTNNPTLTNNLTVFVSAASMSAKTYSALTTDSAVFNLGTTSGFTTAAASASMVNSTVSTVISDTTPTLSGVLGAALIAGSNEVVGVYVDGAWVGTASVTGNNWSYDATLAIGTHTLKVQIEDATSHVGRVVVATQSLVVSSPTPPTAVVTSLTANDDVATNSSTTGALSANTSTDDTLLALSGAFTGTLGTYEVVQVFDGSTLLGAATVGTGTWSFNTATLPAGSHTFTAKVTNIATGLSTTSTASALTVIENTVALGVPVVTVDTGTSVQSNYGRYIILYRAAGAFDMYEVQAWSNGVNVALGRTTITTNMSPANSNFTLAQLTDGNLSGNGWAAGGASPASNDWIQIDLGQAYALSSVVLQTRNNNAGNTNVFLSPQSMSSAASLSDLTSGLFGAQLVGINTAVTANVTVTMTATNTTTTVDTSPTLNGTLGAALGTSEVVAVYVDNVKVGKATVSGLNWSYTPGVSDGLTAGTASALLSTGSHTVKAQIESSTGTVLAGMGTASVTVQAAVAPATTTSLVVTDNTATNGSYTGALSANSSTDATTLALSGTLTATLGSAEVVQIYDSTSLLGTAAVSGTTWTYSAANLVGGSHTLSAKVTNRFSGLSGTAQSLTVLENGFSGPTLSVHSGELISGSSITDTHPNFSGTLPYGKGAGEVLGVYVDGTRVGTAIVSGNVWSFAYGTDGTSSGQALALGSHTVKVQIDDNGSTPQARVVQSQTFSVFSQTPTALVNALTVTDNVGTGSAYSAGNYTGTVTSGMNTDASSLTVAGTLNVAAAAGEAVYVYDGTTFLGSVTPSGTAWTYNATGLALGSHNLSAKLVNTTTGQASTSSATPVSFWVNSLSVPTLTVDTGSVTGSAVTDTTPTLSGTLGTALTGSNDVVGVYDTVAGVTTRLGAATVTGTAWTYTPSAALTVGNHTVTVQIESTDVIPVVRMAQSQSLTIAPTTAPAAQVSGLTVTDTVGSSTAYSAGNYTGPAAAASDIDDTKPVLSGTLTQALASGDVVRVYDTKDGITTLLGTATVTGTGTSWTFTPTSALALGNHSLTAQVSNTYTGLSSVSASPFAVTLNSMTGIALSVSAGETLNTSGAAPITSDTTPTFSGGFAKPLGASDGVGIYVDGLRVGSASVSGASWTYTTGVLSSGSHVVTAQVESLADQSIRIVQTQAFVVQAAAAPVAQVKTLNVSDSVNSTSGGDFVGVLSSGAVTDDARPVVSGTLSQGLLTGEVVQVLDGTTVLGTATVTGTAWSFASSSLGLGLHTISARTANSLSNAITAADAAATPVDIRVNSLGAVVLSVSSGETLSGTNTTDTTPIFSGTLGSAVLGSDVVAVYIDGVRQGTASVSGTAWTYTPTTALGAGAHAMKVQVESADATSMRMAQSQAFTIVASGNPTAVVSSLAVTDDVATNGSVTGTIVNNTSTDDTVLALTGAITGTLGTGEVVQVFDGSTLLGTATVTAGMWSFNTATLPVGSHTFSAKVTNTVTGLSSTSSANALTTIVNTEGAIQLTAHSGSTVSGTNTNDLRPILSGSLGVNINTGTEVVGVYDTFNGTTTRLGDAVVTSTNGVWSYSFSPSADLSAGSHTIKVQVEDIATHSVARVVQSQAITVTASSVTAIGSTITVTDDVSTNGSYVGSLSGGMDTDDTTLTVTGTVATALKTGEYVAITDNGTYLGSATVTGTNWTYTTTARVAGSHTLAASVSNGVTSSTASTAVTVTENTVALGVPVVTVDTGTSVQSNYGRYIILYRAAGAFDMYEVQAWSNGVNVALGRTTITTNMSPANSNFTLAQLTDGNLSGNGWAAGGASPASNDWIQIDLGQAYALSSVVLQTRNNNAGNTNVFLSPQSMSSAASLSDLTSGAFGAQLVGINTAVTANVTVTLTTTNTTTTADTSPTLNGTLSTALGGGDVVAVYVDGVKVGKATVSGLNWSYTPGVSDGLTAGTPSALLSTGSHTVKTQIESSTGTALMVADTVTVTVQAAATPTATTTLVVTDNTATNGSYTGALSANSSTDATTLALSGTLTAPLGSAEVVQIYDGTSLLGTAAVSGTSWTYSATGLTLGSHTLSAQVFNIRSNLSGVVSQSLTINEESLSMNTVAGPIASNTPITGTLGAALTSAEVLGVYVDGTRVSSITPTTANGVISWSYTPNLSAGNHTIKVQIEDANRNMRLVQTQSVTVASTSAPAAQVATLLVTDGNSTDYAAGDYTGTVSSGTMSTDHKTPVISGTLNQGLAAGDVLNVYDTVGGVASLLGTATVTGTSWTFSTALSLGSHSISANVANGLTPNLVSTSLATPVALTVNSLGWATLASDSGAVLGNLLPNTGASASTAVSTTDTTPVLGGTLGAALATGEQVGIYDNGTFLGTATVSGLTWSYSPAALAVGIHNLQVRIEDSATQTTRMAQSQSLQVMVPSATPVASVNSMVVTDAVNTYSAGDQAAALTQGSSTNDTKPVISGTLSTGLQAGEVVQVFDGSNLMGTATVSGFNWSYTPSSTQALSTGAHTLTAKVTNLATGNASAASTFTLVEQAMTGISVTPAGGTAQTGSGVRYVMVRRDTSSADYFSLGDVQVIVNGVNIAAGKTITSSEGAMAGTSLTNLSDGSASTAFITATPASTGWVQLDLGALYNVSSVVVQAETSQGKLNNNSWAFVSASDMSGSTLAALKSGAAGAVTLGQIDAVAGGDRTFTVPAQASPSATNSSATVAGSLAAALGAGEQLSIYVKNGTGAYVLSGTATVAGDRSWSYSASGLSTGANTFRAQIEDAFGNVRLAQTQTLNILPNVTPTTTASITTVSDNFNLGVPGGVDFTGNLVSGSNTTDPTLALSGSLTAALSSGEVLQVLDNGTVLGTATVTGTTWTFNTGNSLAVGNSTTSGLAVGSHDLTVRVLNTGNSTTGNASSAFNVVEQTLGAVLFGTDTGVQNSLTGRYLMIRHPGYLANWNFMGIGELQIMSGGVNVALGKTVTQSNWVGGNGQLPGNAVDGISKSSDLTWENMAMVNSSSNNDAWLMVDLGASFTGSIDSISVISSYLYSISSASVYVSNKDMSGLSWNSIQQMAALGNQGVSLLTTTPNVNNGNVSEAFVLGTTGRVFTDTTPTFSGTLGAALGSADVVGVYVDGTRLGSAVVTTSNGVTSWSLTAATALSTGSHSITVAIERGAGGTAMLSRSDTFSISADASQALSSVVASPSLTAAAGTVDVTGNLSAPFVAGQKIAVYDGAATDSNLLGYASVSNGATTFAYTATGLGVGAHTLYARVLNADNSVGTSTAGSASVTVTGSAPTQTVSVLGGYDTAGAFATTGRSIFDLTAGNGTVSSGDTSHMYVTGDNTPGMYGRLSSVLGTNESLQAYVDGVAVAGTLNVSGVNWNFTPTTALSEGYHDLSFKVVNTTAATVGAASAAYRVEVDAVVDNAASIYSAGDYYGALQGALASGDITDAPRLTINGTLTVPGTGYVQIYDNGTLIGSTWVVNGTTYSNVNGSTVVTNTSTGAWSYQTGPLGSGTHAFTAKFVNTDGVEQTATPVAFTIDHQVQDGVLTNVTSSAGVVTANLTQLGQTLDFTKFTTADTGGVGINKVNLGSFGLDVVKLTTADVLDAGTGLFKSTSGWTFSNAADNTHASTYHQMVLAGSGSTVKIAEATNTSNTDPWVLTGTAMNAGNTYDVYTNLATNNAQLLIDQHLAVSKVVL